MEETYSNKLNSSSSNFKKLKDIFVSINEIKDKQVNLIVKVISTEILVSKRISEDYEMSILEITASDESGSINILLKDEHTKKSKIGQDLIIRNAVIVILNGYIRISCDENTTLFEKEGLVKKIALEVNFSKIKLNTIEPLANSFLI